MRQVSAQILALISQYATNGQCEKTSYDDFYVEVVQGASAAACVAWEPPADSELHILGGGSFHMLPLVLQLGAQDLYAHCEEYNVNHYTLQLTLLHMCDTRRVPPGMLVLSVTERCLMFSCWKSV